ncbi:ankyrin repeat domain-containing protein 50-like [Liolophura sinensis]|uniref:ankyrin repeat domain-containing protein 50-like n=1 Tax=Liolophura sinensis TaxID=3198878 RepID=UPI0031587485
MVVTTLIETMNARSVKRGVSLYKEKRLNRWRDKSDIEQGSMVRKLPPERPRAEDPILMAELLHLKKYQGERMDTVSDWENSVTVVPMLHKVCFEGYVNTAQKLLDEGEDVNQCIDDGPKLLRFLHGGFVTYTAFFLHSTPLMMAAHQGHVPVLKLLIRKGAKVDQRDRMGCSAFSLAVSSQRMDACRLLLKHGADINNVDHKYNFTPIILACRKNDTELAKWLIKKGANVRLTDVYGRNSLHYAAWNYNQELVRLLLSHRLDVNGRDFSGWSPIHYAVGELELDPTLEQGIRSLPSRLGSHGSQGPHQ